MSKKTEQPTRKLSLGMFSIEVCCREITGPRRAHKGWSKTDITVNITHTGIKVNGMEDLTLLSDWYDWDMPRDHSRFIDDITELALPLSYIAHSPLVHYLREVTEQLIEELVASQQSAS